MDAVLQVTIEILVRIELGRVRREIAKLDGLRMLRHPRLDRSSMMDPQIVENQDDFPLGIFDQAVHELNEPLRIHAAFKQAKAHFPLVVDRRNHVERLSVDLQAQHRGLALRSIAASMLTVGPQARLIPPVDLRPFALRSSLNRRIVFD